MSLIVAPLSRFVILDNHGSLSVTREPFLDISHVNDSESLLHSPGGDYLTGTHIHDGHSFRS